jgi:hypothetical protein
VPDRPPCRRHWRLFSLVPIVRRTGRETPMRAAIPRAAGSRRRTIGASTMTRTELLPARPRADRLCESDEGDWGSICPECGRRLPSRPDPLQSWHAGRASTASAPRRPAPPRTRPRSGAGTSNRATAGIITGRQRVPTPTPWPDSAGALVVSRGL